FPETQSVWASMPGKPKGRRPAYLAFETNDGQPKRYFTFLDLHAPDNNTTHIQAYSAHVYASSREIQRVETVGPAAGAAAGRAAAIANLQAPVDPLLAPAAPAYGPQLTVRPGSVSNAVERIRQLADLGVTT